MAESLLKNKKSFPEQPVGRNKSFNAGRQKQQATKQRRMWGKEEAMKVDLET